ncbi:NAD-dependent epimerase/dehydratase family protein [Flavobacterium foetidum]|uniref:NAD-dependent epimerase/dehydratase family protein n=1 Tax=Flavobacterium foetidum TaxID=2026681 RepID=UPI001075345A|nr:NAD-dependent epimerase/dehydratase [Flavobacterium foetidum]KAF2513530.1 NAD-dependent epimerase/dehydratase family protein [Flavobacterium foetidum]
MILLTGTSGFIGAVLLDKLIDKYGADNILALTSSPIEKCRYLLHNNYNVSPDSFLRSDFENIDTIIHAGAFTPKQSTEANEYFKCNSNIINTEALLKLGFPNLKRFIFLSTLDVYAVSDIINENSVVNPISLYGHSKVYCEKMITSWANQQNVLHQILRIGHVYGPGEEKYLKAIPVMIMKILNNEPIQIIGSGKDIRSFIFIDDVVNAIVKSMDLTFFNGPINIVSENQISIENLARQLIKIANSKVDIDFVKTTNDNIRRDFIFDNSKMKKYLLSKEINFIEGLRSEFNYMKKIKA